MPAMPTLAPKPSFLPATLPVAAAHQSESEESEIGEFAGEIDDREEEEIAAVHQMQQQQQAAAAASLMQHFMSSKAEQHEGAGGMDVDEGGEDMLIFLGCLGFQELLLFSGFN
jgi:uncharacterized protein (DUF305 family)